MATKKMGHHTFWLLAILFASIYLLVLLIALSSISRFIHATPRLSNERDMNKLRLLVRTQSRAARVMPPALFTVFLLLGIQIVTGRSDLINLVFALLVIGLDFLGQVRLHNAARKIQCMPARTPEYEKARNQILSIWRF